MANPLRKVGEGTLGSFEAQEMSPADAAKMELLALGENGYRIFVVEDLDWATYAPWVVAKSDDSIWILEGGQPARGFRPDSHAVVVDRNNTWRYLTSSASSDRRDAPRDLAELERRKREKEEQAKRQADHPARARQPGRPRQAARAATRRAHRPTVRAARRPSARPTLIPTAARARAAVAIPA